MDAAVSAPAAKRATVLAQTGLAAILVLFLGLTTLYNVSNPLFEAPDEIWHYLFAKHVRETWQLPLQAPTRRGVIGQQEAGQGPVYYVLGAVLTSWIPSRPAEEWLRPNPHASIGAPLSEDNKNRFVHGPNEDFPYRGDILAAHLLRFLSTLFGAGTVLFTYLLGRELWPGRPAIALGAASLNAFIPQFIYISAAINNDVPVAFFCSATLWLAVRLVRSPSATAWHVVALGSLSGFAIITKSAALATVPLIVATLALIAWRRRAPHFALWSVPLALVTSVVLTGWWFLRNATLYGELLPLKSFLDRASLDDQIPTLAEVINDLTGLRASFWALFGWFSIPVDARLYFFFDAVLLVALAGLALLAFDPRRRRGMSLVTLLLVVSWAVLVVAALLRYRLIVQAFQGRLLFPAVSAIALLVFLGWSALLTPRSMPVLGVAFGMAMLIIAVLMPFNYIQPPYARPAPVRDSDVGIDARRSGALFGTQVELFAYQFPEGAGAPGQTLSVTLYWRARESMPRDYSVFVHVLDWQGRLVAQKDTFPGGGNYATSLWQPGELVRDTYHIKVPADLSVPSVVQIEVGLYAPENMERLPVQSETAQVRNSAVLLAKMKALPTSEPERCAQGLTDMDFGGQAILEGYSLAAPQARPGAKLTGQLCWRASDPLDRDYTVFVQLVGPSGLVAQDDAQPRQGAFPTSVWSSGDRVVHPFAILIGAQVAPARYQLIAGLYDVSSGRRLPVGAGDFAALGYVDVVPR